MKAIRRVAELALVAVFATACVVSIGGGGDSGSKPRHEPPKPAPSPVVMVPGNTEDAAVLAEIDAAAKLGFDSNRTPALKNLAARPSLTPPTQVHLVNTTLRALEFDSGKVEVLKTLIDNPGFSTPAREAILRQIELLSFEASRSSVLAAIQSRAAGR